MNAGRLKSALRLVTTFLAGHGALQGLNIITGLFLIRALSIEAYAQYSLAMAFQVTAVSLTNLGLTDTIIPLVGSRGKDLAIVGKYVQAARALRTRLFLVVAPCCAAAFYALVRSHHWSNASFAVLLVSLLASLYWSVSIACWSAPLILNHRLSDYYLGQIAATAARLVIYVVANIGRVLSAGFAAAVTAVSLLLNGAIARRLVAPFVDLSQPVDPAGQAGSAALHAADDAGSDLRRLSTADSALPRQHFGPDFADRPDRRAQPHRAALHGSQHVQQPGAGTVCSAGQCRPDRERLCARTRHRGASGITDHRLWRSHSQAFRCGCWAPSTRI